VAAINIGGQTINSFAGIGLGQGDIKKMLSRVKKSATDFDRWQKTKVLIIDEISMVSVQLFQILDQIGRMVHDPNKSFGGIQIIVVGDFLQLPPIGPNPDFCFNSK
jgi:ATP-dependent DNA helicase PIF1